MNRFAWVNQPGSASDVVHVRDDELPTVGAGRVRVNVHAAPILPLDRLRIHGHYPLAMPVPGVPGSVGSGLIASGPRTGQPVLLPMHAGSWTRFVDVPADTLMSLPDDVDLQQAALARVNGLTAQALLDGLVGGSWVIMNAATGGVSHYALQLAARMGVRTVAVVRKPTSLPANHVVVDGPNLAARVRELVPDPINRGLDGVGGESTAQLGACLAMGGRVVHYGSTSRKAPRLHVADSIFRGILLQGFWLHRHDDRRGPDATKTVLHRMLELGFTGKLDSTWSLSHLALALERDAHAERNGRVLLTPHVHAIDA